jgi:hypothetical protein
MVNNKSFSEAETIKFLGLQLDNHLTCKGHIDLLLHKLSTVSFLMGKLYYMLNINDLKTVYSAYCHSLVQYGIIYWGNASGSNQVFILQKKIIRIMVGVGPRRTCRGLFRKLNILPIPCVYIFVLMMFVINNLEKFQTNPSIHGINTRNSAQLQRPITNLSSYQRGVYYSGIKLFSSLPINIINLKNDKKQFRIALRSYLQTHSFYSVEELIVQSKHPHVNGVLCFLFFFNVFLPGFYQ